MGNEAFTFNLVFTRVVNHCVTVLGIEGSRPPGRRGESQESVTADSSSRLRTL